MFCRNNSKGDFFAVSNLLCSCITYPLGICDICDISDISWVVFFSTEDKIKLFYRERVQVERMKNKKKTNNANPSSKTGFLKGAVVFT